MFKIKSDDDYDPTTDEPLYWNNEHGWVDESQATLFTDEEAKEFNLPLGGQWVETDETIAVVSSDGRHRAVATTTRRRCTETCRGTVVRAVWPDGEVTYPCLRGCSWSDAYQAYVIRRVGRRARTKKKGSLARVTVPNED